MYTAFPRPWQEGEEKGFLQCPHICLVFQNSLWPLKNTADRGKKKCSTTLKTDQMRMFYFSTMSIGSSNWIFLHLHRLGPDSIGESISISDEQEIDQPPQKGKKDDR